MMLQELLTNIWLRVRALATRRKLDRDLDDEVSFHLAMRRQKLENAGLPPEEASAVALRRFGNPALLREAARSLWSFAWIDALVRDLRYACRGIARYPAFTSIAIVTLAFGIGANTAVFSILNAILLRAMPYRNPGQIYAIHEVVQVGPVRNEISSVNGGNVLEWTRSARSFAAIAALEPTNDDIAFRDKTTGDGSAHVHGFRASASLFRLLGIQPRLGRAFTPEEDEMGHGLEIVLTDALWRESFGANPAILGQVISLNGYPATIVGVLPESFYFPKQEELYGSAPAGWTFGVQYFLNLNLGSWERSPGVGNFNFVALGRVAPGVTREKALAELELIETSIGKQANHGASLHAELVPLKAAVIGPARSRVWMLMAGAALVLVIVCVNLAGLLLARNATRSREVAIRLALGASRATVIRQFIVEGLGLAAVGGVLGVVAAYSGVRLLVRYAPITLPRLESVTMDGRVLLFSAVAAIGTGLLFSVLPALHLKDRSIEATLRSTTLSVGSSRRTAFLHDLLAGLEIALCTVLLVCALFLAESLSRVLRDNAWLNEEHVLSVDIAPSPKQYQDDGPRIDLYRKLVRAARQLPGVTDAGLVSAVPLRGETWKQDVDFAEVPTPEVSRPVANLRFVSPGYDDAIRLALISGRSLRQSDWGHEVALVSESLTRLYPGRNLVGMHIKWQAPATGKSLSLEIAGIMADVRAGAEQSPVLTVYIPYWIWPPWGPSLVVRTAVDPMGIAAAMRKMVRDTDSQVPVTRVETLRDVLDTAVASRRFLTRLGVVFAASATFLAALGLYGVVSLAAARRRHEIAIRIAVGASHPDVFRMVILRALWLTLASVAVGICCGAGVERIIASLLYEVRPADLGVYAGACAIVTAVGLVASLLPALRAARVDPVVALKYE